MILPQATNLAPNDGEDVGRQKPPYAVEFFFVCYFYLFARFSVIKFIKLKESNKKGPLN